MGPGVTDQAKEEAEHRKVAAENTFALRLEGLHWYQSHKFLTWRKAVGTQRDESQNLRPTSLQNSPI